MISVRAWGSPGCWKGYSDGINLDLEGLIAVAPKRNGEPSSTYPRCHFAVSSPVSFFELFFLFVYPALGDMWAMEELQLKDYQMSCFLAEFATPSDSQ